MGLEFSGGRRSWVGALPTLMWVVLAGRVAASAWLSWPSVARVDDLAPSGIQAALFLALALASWRGSRWPVLAAEFLFIANTVSMAAGWTSLAGEFVGMTVLLGLGVAVGFEQWPALHWGLVARPPFDPDDRRSVWARLHDFLGDVPPTLLIGGLGLGSVLLIWSVSIVLTHAFSSDPRSVAFAFLAVAGLGLAGGALLTALARLSRMAALVSVVVPLLYVAAHSPGAFDPLHAAPSSLVLAVLFLPHWRRMTWRLGGYEVLPRGVARAFS